MHHRAVGSMQTGWVAARPSQLRSVRHQLAGWARSAGLNTDQVESLALAVYEALANVVDHAYRGSRHPRAQFMVSAEAVGDGTVTVTVADRGRWRPQSAGPSARGHGLVLMRKLTDDLTITSTEEGTTVVMCWQMAAPARMRR